MSLQSVGPRTPPPTSYPTATCSRTPTHPAATPRDLIDHSLALVPAEHRDSLRVLLENKYYPTCAKCNGRRYMPAPPAPNATPQLVGGVLSFVTPAQPCPNCNGSGKEPDCDLCNNFGNVCGNFGSSCWKCPRGAGGGGGLVSPL